jgi:primosomal protein N' (replication factor Y)
VAAAQHDYDTFYEDELDVRRRMGYPPFRRLARVLIQNTHPIEAERRADDIAQHLRQRINALEMHDTHLIGPAPCFFSRIDRYYRWQVLLRGSDPLPALQELQLVSRPDKGQTEYLDIDALDML